LIAYARSTGRRERALLRKMSARSCIACVCVRVVRRLPRPD